MNERIKELRKSLGLTLEKFGEKIKIKKSSLSTIENGKTNPSEQTISLICREFNVNEEWLRTGKGEMFNHYTRDEEISMFLGDIQSDKDATFKKKLVSILAKLDEEDWLMMEKFAKKIIEENKKED